MDILRTPDERFENLPDYPFTAHYVTLDDGEGGTVRMHYIDEGHKDAEVILMLHGEPSWSFLYRKMIPLFVAAGYRAIAPDLIGFGRSDKPTKLEDYTHQRHIDWLSELLKQLQLTNINLVCQDWGGLLGLHLVANTPEKFSRVIAANTLFPIGDTHPGEEFTQWQQFALNTPELPVGSLVANACSSELSAETIAAYDAPFPDERYKNGARQFPMLAPVSPEQIESKVCRVAWQKLRQFTKPFLTAFSDQDPATAAGAEIFQQAIPGCQDQRHVTIAGAGHFLQEDKGEQLAEVTLLFINSNQPLDL